jgi:hypothetical protein
MLGVILRIYKYCLSVIIMWFLGAQTTLSYLYNLFVGLYYNNIIDCTKSIQSSPDFRRNALTSFAPKPTTLSQARRFVPAMLKMSSSQSHDQERTLDDPVEIQKWICCEEAEQPEPEPEPEPEPKERTMTFWTWQAWTHRSWHQGVSWHLYERPTNSNNYRELR